MACDHGQLRQVWVICPRELPSPSQLSWQLPAASQPSPPVAIRWLFLLFQSARFPCCTPAALFQCIRLPEGFHPSPLRRREARRTRTGQQGQFEAARYQPMASRLFWGRHFMDIPIMVPTQGLSLGCSSHPIPKPAPWQAGAAGGLDASLSSPSRFAQAV